MSVNLIVGGTDVRSVRFTVEGGDLSSPLEGRFNVHDDQDPPIWATIMDLSPGDYEITLVALDDTGEVLCTGSQGFAVLEGQITQVDVALLCTVGDGSEPLGNADIEGRFEIVEANLCPRLNYVGVIPDVIEEGGSADVEVLAQDSDGQTVQVTLSATAGTLSPASFDIVPPANGGLSSYTCTTSGTQTVTATVSDGDALCDKAKSAPILCGDAALSLCQGVDCSSSNQCIDDGICDPGSGFCLPGDHAPEGTACDQASGTVCDGVGSCVECNNDADCFPPPYQCVIPTCAQNVCELVPVEDGTLCDYQYSSGENNPDDGYCADGDCTGYL